VIFSHLFNISKNRRMSYISGRREYVLIGTHNVVNSVSCFLIRKLNEIPKTGWVLFSLRELGFLWQ
jgi:hypothetical protein